MRDSSPRSLGQAPPPRGRARAAQQARTRTRTDASTWPGRGYRTFDATPPGPQKIKQLPRGRGFRHDVFCHRVATIVIRRSWSIMAAMDESTKLVESLREL